MRTGLASLLTVLALAPAPSMAEAATYRWVPGPGGTTGIRFEIPYTMGTHRGEAGEARGTVELDLETNAVRSASFAVPIASIRTGKTKMECHLRSSLGLDYAASAFPEKHVCDGDDRLPASGPDAVAYPDIRFESSAATVEGKLSALETGGPVRVEVDGTWSIHGVSKPGRVTLNVERAAGSQRRLLVRGTATFQLADFGIVVKPFLFIRVKDPATASFELLLEPVEGPEVH